MKLCNQNQFIYIHEDITTQTFTTIFKYIDYSPPSCKQSWGGGGNNNHKFSQTWNNRVLQHRM